MSMPLNLLFLQNLAPTEVLLILVVALLVFGGRLPQVARNLGKSFVEFKKGLRDLNTDLRNELDMSDRPAPPRPREQLPQPPVNQPAPVAKDATTEPTPPTPAPVASSSTTSTPETPAPQPPNS